MEIFPFDYKQKYKIPNDGQRRFGIELELIKKTIHDRVRTDKPKYGQPFYINTDEFEDDRQDSASEISKYFEGWCIFKHDGSIPGGFEIVTHPLTLEQQRQKWTPEVFEALNNLGFISFSAETCGHHAHVSRKGLSRLQIGKTLKFIHNKSNRVFIKKIAQREDKQYAEFSSPMGFSYLRQIGKEKYHAFNLKYPETVEFRLFKGTLNYSAFHKNLEFCDSLLNFCSPCNTSVKESLVWWNYMEYISRRVKEYPNLWNYCQMKQMECTDSWNIHKEEIKAKKEQKKLQNA